MLVVKSLTLLAIVNQVGSRDLPPAELAGDITRKLYVYYEGKYFAQGDGSPVNAWRNWASNAPPSSSTNATFELYPDTRKYTRLYPTNYANLNNGNPANLFSSWDDSTVDLHFTWMQENNIDGVALERDVLFAADPAYLSQANGMHGKVRTCAEKYNMKYYIVYDIIGWNNFAAELPDDVDYLIQRKAFDSKAYAKQSGVPVIGINGIGSNYAPHSATVAKNIIQQLQRSGFYVIGGVPWKWMRQSGDSQPAFMPAYSVLNMIQPIIVGRYQGIDYEKINQVVRTADLAWCNDHNIGYLPVLYPGVSNVSRLHGDFFWSQFVTLRETGIKCGIVYTFDGFQEATAIAPAAEDISMIPNGAENTFRRLDEDSVHVSSDFYLRLAREGGRMMKIEIPLKYSHNIPLFVDSSDSASVHSGDWMRGIQFIVLLMIVKVVFQISI